MGEQYCDILKRALEAIEKGELPDEEDMEKLREAYANALNASPCPCGEGGTFEDCCKVDWQVLIRSVRGIQRERREAQRERNSEQAGKPDSVKWLARLGVVAGGGIRVEAMDPSMANPFQLAGMLLDAYHNVFAQAVIQMTNNAVGNLADAVGVKPVQPKGRPRLV